jgi:hypothetical protein
LGTKSKKDAFKKTLDVIAKHFGHERYVMLTPKNEEIATEFEVFFELVKKDITDTIESHEKIMQAIKNMIAEDKLLSVPVTYLCLPTGAVNKDGSIVHLDPLGEERKFLVKRLELHA